MCLILKVLQTHLKCCILLNKKITQNRPTLPYNVHKIPVLVKCTHTTPKISLNSADRSSDVVFLIASGFLEKTSRKLKTMRGCLLFYMSSIFFGLYVPIVFRCKCFRLIFPMAISICRIEQSNFWTRVHVFTVSSFAIQCGIPKANLFYPVANYNPFLLWNNWISKCQFHQHSS